MIGGGWLNLKPGEVTDDTQMTICVAHGILDALEGYNGLDLVASLGQQFIAWADSKPKDIGGTAAARWRATVHLPTGTLDIIDNYIDDREKNVESGRMSRSDFINEAVNRYLAELGLMEPESNTEVTSE